MNASAFDRLCSRFGIAPEYTDIWGHPHIVSDDTRRALLRAMGVDAGGEAEARTTLERTEARQWRRLLPPVKVVRSGAGTLEIELSLPATRADETWHWKLVEEGGWHRTGEFIPAGLELRERRSVDGEPWQRMVLALPEPPVPGYHRFEIEAPNRSTMTLIVAPPACYQPEAIQDEGRVWGVTMPLYSLRSQRNWGIGDFTDLTRVLELAAREGAGVVGLNPLHAAFPDNPGHASPYSPSSRMFLNVLYLDVEAIPDFAELGEPLQQVASEDFQARLRALRAADHVDYVQVADLKLQVLEQLYGHFRERHLSPGSMRAEAFRSFQARQGKPLHRHALFEALQEHFHRGDPSIWGWPVWPEAYRDPDSGAVAAFAGENVERVTFFEYLQWQAQRQLGAAGRRAFELGLGVGIYQDLAVSIDCGGSEAWANQALYALDARIGSPPDDFNLQGQDWGLPPWVPESLRESAYEPFIATLRSNMHAAGALRIDHVTALWRLFWIPAGSAPAGGAYVRYPFEDLLGILALESQRNRCLVIGEDLGTVPDAVRRTLNPRGVLSYRLLYFEKNEDGGFRAPEEYPAQALISVSTHDLPTLTGFWSGHDIEWRRRLELFPSEEDYEKQVIHRAEDRARLLIALEREGLLPEGADVNPVSTPEMTAELACAVHLYLAKAPARVLVVQPEDMLGQSEQSNLPGTIDAHPNWQRKQSLEIESWPDEPRIATLFAALREARGTAVRPPALPAAERPVGCARIPRATYRLQFNRDFTLDDATALVPYLDALGISHCYASPLIKSRSGSAHGYDIVEHNALNPELGAQPAFQRFTDTLQSHDMGLILDVVPNHMGIMGHDNPWWLDVLENGPASRFAKFFDIDWNPLKEELRGKVLLPVLDDHYGNVLDRGSLILVFDAANGAFSVDYFEHRFPLDPREYPRIFAHRQAHLAERLGAEHSSALGFASLMTAFAKLPLRINTTPRAIAERSRDGQIHKQRLAQMYASDADIARYIDEALRDFNGAEDYPADPTLFHELLQVQAWRLAFWRVAADQINYRRFFDINELAALRMEHRDVFDATHGLLFELIAQGRLQGLRIDHPDGLFDPARYFQRIQEHVTSLVAAGHGDIEGNVEDKPLYIVAEKILAADERLPVDWRVHGTTGYDFARVCGGLSVDADAKAPMNRSYGEFTGEPASFSEVAFASKKLIMQEALASELNVLATELARIAETDTHSRDFTLTGLRQALETVIACFPVYRTYVTADGSSPGDEAYIEQAVAAARRRSAAADLTIFDFVRDVILNRQAKGKDAPYRARVTRFAMKFQQLTSPVTAKGMEDTAFYRYNRLVSLNEVGGEPDRFGTPVAEFHLANARRRKDWPGSLLSTSTHDTKRAEDVRARIHALSELPAAWRDHASRWAQINHAHKRETEGGPAPSSNDEYLLYQTLIGACPLEPLDESALSVFVERIRTYMLKAAREAKRHTSWVNPNPEYESALHDFIDAVLDPFANSRFVSDFRPFQRRIARIGLFNSLSQTLFKLTAPGVPDIYQGNELWDFSLVDPDNRRTVDFPLRRTLLEELERDFGSGAVPRERLRGLVEDLEDGRIKLYLTWKCLGLRRRAQALFERGDYLPLTMTGQRAKHLCGFARRRGALAVIAAAPRLVGQLLGVEHLTPTERSLWRDTRIELPASLSGCAYTNVLTGEELRPERIQNRYGLPAGILFPDFPVVLLYARGMEMNDA
jgi:(1->4)-alpha-D-glucan 1-alpha-D-glucosylmutase